MSKKIKFLICLIIILVVIGLTFGISTLYRFYKIQKIFSKIDENIAKDNYYLKTTVSTNNKNSVTETYYKEGIGKLVAENGIYTWVDGKDAYLVDEENKKIYTLNIEESLGLVSSDMFTSMIPGYRESAFKRFLIAGNIKNKIKSTKLDNQDCTMIVTSDEKSKKTVWIDKNRMNIVKAKVELTNGETFDYSYELKFNTTKLKDVELPDITEYSIINGENGEIVLDKSNTTSKGE